MGQLIVVSVDRKQLVMSYLVLQFGKSQFRYPYKISRCRPSCSGVIRPTRFFISNDDHEKRRHRSDTLPPRILDSRLKGSENCTTNLAWIYTDIRFRYHLLQDIIFFLQQKTDGLNRGKSSRSPPKQNKKAHCQARRCCSLRDFIQTVS